MTLFQFFCPSKNKTTPHKETTSHEEGFIAGYAKGFERGVQLASEIDGIFIKKLREVSIDEALERINGNNKKTH